MVQFFQILVMIFAIFAVSRVFLRTRDKQISKGEAFFWTIIWALIVFLVFVPWPAITVSRLLGIGRAVDLLVYSAIIVIFYLLFRMYVKIDRIEKETTELVRKVTIQNAEEPKKKKNK